MRIFLSGFMLIMSIAACAFMIAMCYNARNETVFWWMVPGVFAWAFSVVMWSVCFVQSIQIRKNTKRLLDAKAPRG
jgi:hypothetical protein